LTAKFEAIEVINSSALYLRNVREKIEALADRYHVAKLGGSDSHIPQTIGDAYTEVEAASMTPEDVIKAIKKRVTIPCGGSTSWVNRVRKLGMDLLKHGEI